MSAPISSRVRAEEARQRAIELGVRLGRLPAPEAERVDVATPPVVEAAVTVDLVEEATAPSPDPATPSVAPGLVSAIDALAKIPPSEHLARLGVGSLARSRAGLPAVGRLHLIQLVAAEAYEVRIDDLRSQRRTRPLPAARKAYYLLARELTDRSLPDIGRSFGNRDHTTVLHGVRAATDLFESDEAFRERVEWCVRRFKEVVAKTTT